MNIFSLRTATWLGATVVVAGLLGMAGCSSSSSSSPNASASTPSGALTVRQIAYGTTLKHTFLPNGKGAAITGSLTQPDDIVALGGNLYVGFQNGVGSQGEVAPSGSLDSTLVEFTPAGHVVKQWDVMGKIDGMGADPATGRVFLSVNEDSNSSLYVVSGGTVTHYTYAQSPLPHMGGTDAISVLQGKILVSASAPGTSGKAPANAPAVYVVTLNATAKTAAVAPLFAINATATSVNSGTTVTLALTDPDSNVVVPSSSPKLAGDFMLNSQGDLELIFSGASGQNLQVLKISSPVDDSAWATSAKGSLYTTDSSADSVDVITGSFKPGTAYTSVTPCNANSAPAVCPVPSSTKYGPNYLGTINLTTGAVAKVTEIGPLIPKGMVFVP
jgi:hypothetical protein